VVVGGVVVAVGGVDEIIAAIEFCEKYKTYKTKNVVKRK